MAGRTQMMVSFLGLTGRGNRKSAAHIAELIRSRHCSGQTTMAVPTAVVAGCATSADARALDSVGVVLRRVMTSAAHASLHRRRGLFPLGIH